MNQKLLKLIAVVIVSSGLLACAAAGSKLEKQLVSQGATVMRWSTLPMRGLPWQSRTVVRVKGKGQHAL